MNFKVCLSLSIIVFLKPQSNEQQQQTDAKSRFLISHNIFLNPLAVQWHDTVLRAPRRKFVILFQDFVDIVLQYIWLGRHYVAVLDA